MEDFLSQRKEEVLHVMTLDYTWERREELIRQEEYEEGQRYGEAIGQRRGEEIGQRRGEKIGQRRGEKIGQKRGEEIGQRRGEQIGQKRGQESLIQLYTWLRENGRSEEAAKMMQPQNPQLRKVLMKEYQRQRN